LAEVEVERLLRADGEICILHSSRRSGGSAPLGADVTPRCRAHLFLAAHRTDLGSAELQAVTAHRPVRDTGGCVGARDPEEEEEEEEGGGGGRRRGNEKKKKQSREKERRGSAM